MNDADWLAKRKELLDPLRRELENELMRFVGTPRPTARILSTRSMQDEFALLVAPAISEWVGHEGYRLDRELGLAIPIPDDGDEYRRNAVFTATESYIGMFAHVWRPGGRTPIHQHDGFLALACPVGNGAHETKYTLVFDDGGSVGHQTMEDSFRRLDVMSDTAVPSGTVSSIPRGPGSIHVVRNDAGAHCIILEVYVHQRPPEAYAAKPPEERPLYEINTFLKVIGRPDVYYVKRQRPQKLSRPLFHTGLSGFVTLSCDEVIHELRAAGRVAGSVLTARGETFGSLDDVEVFAKTSRSGFVRVDEIEGDRVDHTYLVV